MKTGVVVIGLRNRETGKTIGKGIVPFSYVGGKSQWLIGFAQLLLSA